MAEDVLVHFRLIGDEAVALRRLAAAELRKPAQQTRFILRQELARRGLLPQEHAQQGAQHGQAGGNGDG